MVNKQTGRELAEVNSSRSQESARARDRLDSVVLMVGERAPPDEAAGAGEFARSFYAALPAEYLASTEEDILFAMAMAQWRFMQERAHGAAKLRVYNPDPEIDGWQSPHTVVALR